jgi:CO/xanthine dehydrogenase FAD-binding subunit
MKDIDYYKANNLDEALQILAEKNEAIRIIAGGTDLVVRLKQDMVKEDEMLDVTGLKELKGIYEDNSYIHILPLSTHTEIVENKLVKKYAPVLRNACLNIGSPQIRNKGTIGGNVVNASPAGDSITALFVQEAKLTFKSIKCERTISIEDFFIGPGRTIKQSSELLTDIFLPKFQGKDLGFFRKVGQRKGTAISVVNVAAKLRLKENNMFEKVIVSFGAVAPTVVRGKIVENVLLEGPIDSLEKILYISRLAFREVSPISDIRGSFEYRQDMSTNLLFEGLAELFNNGWRMI